MLALLQLCPDHPQPSDNGGQETASPHSAAAWDEESPADWALREGERATLE